MCAIIPSSSSAQSPRSQGKELHGKVRVTINRHSAFCLLSLSPTLNDTLSLSLLMIVIIIINKIVIAFAYAFICTPLSECKISTKSLMGWLALLFNLFEWNIIKTPCK